MLTKPQYGWTCFHLEGTSTYSLSYLDDIAQEWLTQAIHGLETMLPFCVKGFLEPDRFLCMVSYWNCHIIIEDDERELFEKKSIQNEYSHTSMIDFCKLLYKGINGYVDDWASFVDYSEGNPEENKQQLLQQLAKLKELIEDREAYFGEDRCFL